MAKLGSYSPVTVAALRAAAPINYPSFVLRSVCKCPADVEAILAGTGISQDMFDNPRFRLELPILRRFVSNVIERTQDPHIWLRLAPKYKTEYIGLPAQAALNASTFIDGLATFDRFAPLAFPLIGFGFDRTRAEHETCESGISYHPKFPEDITYSLLGAAFIIAHTVLDEMLQTSGVVSRIECAWTRPKDWAELEPEISGLPFHFGAHRNRIVFPSSWLHRHLPGADPINHQRYLAMCQHLALEPQASASLVIEVLGYIERTRDYRAGQATAASALGYSERTLRRHLAKADTSFAKLKEHVRRAHAQELLINTPLSMQHISDELGYDTPSNFSRSFKRWTGCSPKTFRETRLNGTQRGQK